MAAHRPTARCLPTLCCFIIVLLALTTVAFAETSPAAADADPHHGASTLGSELPLWTCIPFAGILLSIALFPLFAPRWWHHHFPKVSAFWALSFGVPFLIVFRGQAIHEILHVYMLEYIPFIILLWSLFTISGGIHVKGKLRGTPLLNATLLLIGTIIASWVGTTGASMILIRPVLRANEWRRNKVHVIMFFIFLVSNVGGSLTPLGDPPLFLGFLQGVPFFWTFKLIPHMSLVALPLLLIFVAVDYFYYRREENQPTTGGVPVRIEGAYNALFLLGVVGAVLMSGMWRPGEATILGIHVPISGMVRDGILIVLGVVSLRVTPHAVHEANGFSWFPIQEVGYLFAGIFMTIIPALAILKAGTEGGFAFIIESLASPAYYFWITGTLSSFLDNAPSYLTLFNSCIGKFYPSLPHAEAVAALTTERILFLEAISAGSVFFGAVTYIGNAPNFMVKSIAEEAGVRMPSFFGFMFKYSLPIMGPLLLLVTAVFF